MLPNDTDSAVERAHIELLRQAGPEKRLQMALVMTSRTIAAARAGLERANPALSARERDLLWVRMNYGAELADRLRMFLAARDGARR